MTSKQEIREAAESDLCTFARLVNPMRIYGEIHERVFRFLQHSKNDLNQLIMLPRGHQKSHCLAVWAAWWITKHPETTILYISATAQLAEDQLYAIKCIIDSSVYRRYWPEMLDQDEGRRSKWSTTAINVDHPARAKEMVRDNTIRTAGLTTNTTGWHADVIIADDVVVPDNAYTEEGRRKTAASMSQMSSIKNAGGMVKAAGTRYHPSDQYSVWLKQEEAVYNDNDEIVKYIPVWDMMEEVVEVDGVFTWPREARSDGKRFGFDRKILSRIYAEYTDKTQFYAQYYNNPNDPESNRVDRSKFQYYDQKFLKQASGNWFFKENRLNVYAGVDFAFSLSKKSDYTAIVVIGVDAGNDIYVLDIDRFKSDKISEYYERLVGMYNKWEFKKLRAEVTTAQQVIVNDLKQRFKEGGISLKIDEYRPNRNQGSKEERIAAVLEPRYQQQAIWHYRGGYVPVLEDEILLARPAHDDIVDTLASIVEIAQKPRERTEKVKNTSGLALFNKRFGGFGTTMGGIAYGR